MSTVIVSENTADLFDGYYDEHKNILVPLSFSIGDKVYLKEEDISLFDFYEKLKSGVRVRTSQVSMGEVKDVFSKLLSEKNDVIYIAFSSGMSGGCGNIQALAEELKKVYPNNKLTVIDSLSGGGGQGILVYYANKMNDEGKSYEEIVEWLETNKHRVHHTFIVDDLTNIKNSGRISAVTAFIGSVLHIKPVMTIDDNGHVSIVAKSLGRKKAIAEMIKIFEKNYVPDDNDFVLIGHTNELAEAESLANIIKDKTQNVPIKFGYIDKLVSANAGYNALAIYYLGKNRE